MPMMAAAAPTMNVPLIATMPMTTMIQQTPSAVNMTGGGNPAGANNASVATGNTMANQAGGGGGGGGADIIPNAAGVKTLSIKI
jgi:hypothetical protein